MGTKKMVLELAGATGVSGLERGAAQAAQKMLENLGPCEYSPLGNLICHVKPVEEGKPHILLTAHMDEIGMIVSYIDSKGFLRVSNCGGIDRSLALASPVVVHAAGGDLDGVVCTIPPHLNPDEDKVPRMEDIIIDVGLDEAAAKERIALGDRVSFDCEAGELLGGRVCSPTIDDRAGCAAVILAAQKLSEKTLDCGLTVALTVMEEVGGQGARTAAQQLRPDLAIAVDVSFGRSPGVDAHKSGELGGGPMIGIAPALDNGLFAAMKKAAKIHDIPCQIEVMGGATGTDADQIVIAGAGVRCAMLSIPLRYMHTPVEVVQASDVEAVANLIAAYIADEFGGIS